MLTVQTKDKQGEIEALLGKLGESGFPDLVRLGQNIKDFGQDDEVWCCVLVAYRQANAEEAMDQEIGVALVFDKEDGEEEVHVNPVFCMFLSFIMFMSCLISKLDSLRTKKTLA